MLDATTQASARRLVLAWLSAGLLLAMSLPALAAGAASKPTEGERYLLHCSGCHRPDGRGVPGTTPSLHDLAPFLASARGRAYLVRIPGVAQAPLDDAALAELLGWVLTTFSHAIPEPPFTAAEVGRLRREPLRDPPAERRSILWPSPSPSPSPSQ